MDVYRTLSINKFSGTVDISRLRMMLHVFDIPNKEIKNEVNVQNLRASLLVFCDLESTVRSITHYTIPPSDIKAYYFMSKALVQFPWLFNRRVSCN